jgi:hypothetical protein
MRKMLYLVVVLLAGCAGIGKKPDADTYHFDCDVPPAKFSQWDRPLSSAEVSISGKVALLEGRPDARWWPLASVYFFGADGATAVGMQLFVAAAAPNELQISLKGTNGNEDRISLGAVPLNGEPVPFTMALTGGQLTLSGAGKAAGLRLADFVPTKFALACSTGQFEFTDLILVQR